MPLTTPILQPITFPFNATLSYDVNFTVIGGNQVVRNNLVINRVSDGIEVYNQTVESFQFKHTIPSSTLINGTEYKIRIRTGDVNNNWSTFSDYVIFYCFSPPTVNITNIINGIVNNQTYTFSGSYSQSESEILQSYRFLLYDENSILLESYPEKYDGLLQQEIAGLENDKNYKIELKVITANNLQGSSGLISFKASYLNPRLMTVLTLENDSSQASIQASAQVVQIIGKIDNGSVSYENNDWINLLNGQISFEEGFSISNDFTLKIWCKNLIVGQVFLKLVGTQGYIEYIYENNCIKAFKKLYSGGIVPIFSSNELVFMTTDTIFIWSKQVNGLMDLVIEKLI